MITSNLRLAASLSIRSRPRHLERRKQGTAVCVRPGGDFTPLSDPSDLSGSQTGKQKQSPARTDAPASTWP
jgi:hypothetical protein